MPGTKEGGKDASAEKRGEYREKGHPAARPREAATLVIVRQDQQPRVLMGKRAASHQFMPNKFKRLKILIQQKFSLKIS